MTGKAKAIITIDEDENGHPRAAVVFDPPLPERPNNEADEDAWLEKIPTTQLAAFIVMDSIMDMFGEDMEFGTVTAEVGGNGTKH